MTILDLPANDNRAKQTSLATRLSVPLGIDLSAWISGASFALGVFLAGPSRLIDGLNLSAVLAASYVAFIILVVTIQRHMRLKATATTFGTPIKLTTSGIFKFSRNPIYLAFLLPLAAISMFSIPASIIAIAFYLSAMSLTVIPREEKDLTQIFGHEFTAYAKKTRRWI
jgi:protein-S-isoprenylcysteine O-methyltransferase Ste14